VQTGSRAVEKVRVLKEEGKVSVNEREDVVTQKRLLAGNSFQFFIAGY
jgi:hypothetical protein